MPTLHWIGKEKVINHHQEVPFRILEKQYTYTNGTQTEEKEKTSENKIIHGDNLEALKSLLPEYEGKIKCIYIDPPYNTGKDEWKYNDKVDSPKIRKWLDDTVGKEGEDLARHDKWLCMMYPRLKLLYKLLANDGAIFISIDNNEVYNLKLVLDEIFGIRNFLGNIIWQTTTDNNPTQVVTEHEYILTYAKNKNLLSSWEYKSGRIDFILDEYYRLKELHNGDINIMQKELREFIKENKLYLDKLTHYNNIDAKGVFHDADIANTKFGGYVYEVIHPITKKKCKIPDKGFRYPQETLEKMIENEDVMFGVDETTLIKPKKRLENAREKLRSIIYEDGRASTKNIERMFNKKDIFKNPKSETILEKLIAFSTNKDSIILDSFAGSGTTAHAVLNLNKQDGGNRKFILVEMEDYAESITAERVKRVISGYGEENKAVEGTGGDFSYYELGKPLFLEENILNEEVEEEKIREYIWYSEVKTPYQKQEENYLLGKQYQTAYYFYYDKEKLTTLDENFLRTLKTKAEQYIIYADNCLLDADIMNKHSLIFKKIPRDITRF